MAFQPIELTDNDARAPSAIEQFMAELLATRDEVASADWSLPNERALPPLIPNNRLIWRDDERVEPDAPISLDMLRDDLPEVIYDHIDGGTNTLLIRVAAGAGKTHAAVNAVQRAARNGLRILWCAPRHNMSVDISKVDGYDDQLWYHWLPMQIDNEDESRTTCRYAPYQHEWLKKGYPSYTLCEQVCAFDGHINQCKFRKQHKEKAPIIFARHQHLASGLALNGFDAVVIDESPLSVFATPRLIRTGDIRVEGASGPVRDLLDRIHQIAAAEPVVPIGGRLLFDKIGFFLNQIFDIQEVANIPHMLPQVPNTGGDPKAVADVPHFFIFDLLKIAAVEIEAYNNGWDKWCERIKVGKNGLTLIQKANKWDNLPRCIVSLDATGKQAIYESILDNPVTVYNPQIKRVGSIRQITCRQNGVSILRKTADMWRGGKLINRGELTNQGNQLLAQCQQIASRYTGRVAIITHLSIRSHFEDVFGPTNVSHFYGNRGSNAFQDCECLIVAGNPEPPQDAVVNIASAINPDRTETFTPVESDWSDRPIYVDAERPFNITSDAYAIYNQKTPYRAVKGFWEDTDLQLVHEQLREAELVQVLHRGRPNMRECDVWLLTSTPTDEPLDEVMDTLPFTPTGIDWKTWQVLAPWLDEKAEQGEHVTMQDLATASGKSVKTVKNKKWIESIVEWCKPMWRIGMVHNPDSRKRTKALCPNQ